LIVVPGRPESVPRNRRVATNLAEFTKAHPGQANTVETFVATYPLRTGRVINGYPEFLVLDSDRLVCSTNLYDHTAPLLGFFKRAEGNSNLTEADIIKELERMKVQRNDPRGYTCIGDERYDLPKIDEIVAWDFTWRAMLKAQIAKLTVV